MTDHVKHEQSPLGPPAVWCAWPAALERLVRSAHTARERARRDAWRVAIASALTRFSARIQREPVRVYGLGAAFAFVFGVLLGLL